MAKKVNLDELIEKSVLINIGDPCPICKRKGREFLNTPENDFVKHIIDEHKPEFSKFLGAIENE